MRALGEAEGGRVPWEGNDPGSPGHPPAYEIHQRSTAHLGSHAPTNDLVHPPLEKGLRLSPALWFDGEIIDYDRGSRGSLILLSCDDYF